MLRRKVAAELLDPTDPARLAVTLMSFGFKHGPARDADLLFDVRFLPNPHYEADAAAADRLRRARSSSTSAATGASTPFYARLLPLLEFLLPEYVAEGKSHLSVAIGCTGGRHRSVTIVEELAPALRGRRAALRHRPPPRRRPRQRAARRLGSAAQRAAVERASGRAPRRAWSPSAKASPLQLASAARGRRR